MNPGMVVIARRALMAKPFDNTTKELIELGPADWVAFLGAPGPAERVRLVESNLSTITSEADKVIRVDDAQPWLLHLEMQASRDPDLPRRLLRYAALLQHRHRVPVVSAVVLLRSEANSPELTGEWQTIAPLGLSWRFPYLVIKVWEEPPERFLNGGSALLPLAPISRVTPEQVPSVVQQMKEKLQEASPTEQIGVLWTATNILFGLKYPAEFTQQILRGVMNMKESVTYQAIVREGYDSGIREGIDLGIREGLVLGEMKALIRVGTLRFGAPNAEQLSQLNAITDQAVLDRLLDRVVTADSWAMLLEAASS